MNLAKKSTWSNVITGILLILVAIQGSLTTPPYPENTVFVITGIITFISGVLSALKNYISPDTNNTATKLSLFILATSVLTGISDLLGWLEIETTWAQTLKLIITSLSAALAALGKTLFPSFVQKQRLEQLKKLDKATD